jgi:hypothetical protein
MSSRRGLVFAVAAAWVIARVVPFGSLVMYPFTLLATWVHETGHGLAALATGGAFERLVIFGDASGYAMTREAAGWPVAITCLGGLWAPPLVGASLLAFARGPRRARVALMFLSLLLLTTLALWVRSTAGCIVVPLCALLLGWAAWWRPERRLLFAQFVAVTLALDTLARLIGYALSATAMVNGHEQKSDVALIVDAVGGPLLAWGALVIAVALVMLAIGGWLAWRPSRARSIRGARSSPGARS